MAEQTKNCTCKARLAPKPFFMRAEFSNLTEEEKQKAVANLRDKQTRMILNTLPNLLCYVDDPEKKSHEKMWARFRYIRRSSVIVGELKRLKGMLRVLKDAAETIPQDLPPAEYSEKVAEAQDRALYNLYNPKYGLDRIGFEQCRALMRRAIGNIHSALHSILEENFPPNRLYNLAFNDRVQAAGTMPQLLELMTQKPGKGVFSRRIPFEARVVAVLAQLEFESLIGTHNPDVLDKIRENLMHELDTQVFAGSESATIVVIANLDPENHYRVKQNPDGTYAINWYYEDDPRAKQQTSETVFVERLDVYVIKKNGHSIPVHSRARRKERIFAKQLRKNQRKPELIADLSGLVMVLLNSNPIDEEYLANRLRATVVNCPGLVSAQQSNASRAGAIDPDNPHSSPNRRGEKYEFLWGGIWHELQILALPDFVNSRIAHAQDGHPFYKLVTYLDTLLPFIRPEAIYRMDWFSQEIRDMLWHYLCQKLMPA